MCHVGSASSAMSEKPESENPENSGGIRLSPDALFQEIAGEAVILDLNSSNYFGLEEVGCRFWQLIEEHGDFDIVVNIMFQEYEVGKEQLQQDLLELKESLVTAGLLIID